MTFYAVVGMRHRGTAELVNSLAEGEDLELVREPDNKFDPKAVQVWARGQHVAYIAANQVFKLAAMIDDRQKKFPLGGEAGRLPSKLHWSSDRFPLAEVP